MKTNVNILISTINDFSTDLLASGFKYINRNPTTTCTLVDVIFGDPPFPHKIDVYHKLWLIRRWDDILFGEVPLPI